MCGCLSHAPYWGPGPKPRHVPQLGIELVTLWFTARAQSTELHQPVLTILFKVVNVAKMRKYAIIYKIQAKSRFSKYSEGGGENGISLAFQALVDK